MLEKLPRVTDAEYQVLNLLWEQGPLTARRITEVLYSAARASEIGTVQKLLQRLETKRLVKRDRSLHVHFFSATVSRTAYAGGQLEQMAEKLSDGSLVPLIIHLVRSNRLTKREIQEIRELFERGS